MSPLFVYGLLLLALVVPLAAALAVRLLGNRLSSFQVVGGMGVIFLLAIGSVLVLSRSEVRRLSVGNLTLLLPLTGSSNVAAERAPPPPVGPGNRLPVDDAVGPLTGDTVGLPIVTPAMTATQVLTAPVDMPPAVTETAVVSAPAQMEPTATAQAATATPSSAEPTAIPTPQPVEEEPTATLPPPTQPPEPQPADASPAEPQTYTVQEGDTLRSIAQQYGIETQLLLQANNMTVEEAAEIRPGQELTIPAPGSGEPAAPAEPEPEPAPPEEAAPQPQVYVVESGDTLRGIAEQFGVEVDDLLRVNDMTPEDGDAIYPGQELVVP